MPEWDEQGRPTYSGPTYGAAQAQEWDEDGNPVSDAQPSAFDRFMEGAGQYLNPVKVVRDMGEAARPVDVPGEFGQAVEAIRGGDYGRAARHVGAAVSPFAGPLGPALVPAARMVPAAADAQSGQLIKAYDAAAAGEYGRAVGHGIAGITPLVGPASAAFGERINSGDVAGGLGEATGLLVSSFLPVGAAKVAPAAGRAVAATGRAAANVAPAVLKGGMTYMATGSLPKAAAAAMSRGTLREVAMRNAAELAEEFSRQRALARGGGAVEAPAAQRAATSPEMAARIAAAKARNASEVAAFDAAKARAQEISAQRSAANRAAVEARYAPRQSAAVAPEPVAVAPEAAPVIAEAAPVQARPIPPGAQPVPMTPSRGGLPPGLATQLDQEMAARQAAAAPVESPKWWQEWAANEVAVTRAQIAELKQAPPTPKTEAAIAQRVKYAEGLIRNNPGLLAQVPDVPGPGPRRFVGSDPGYPVPRESWVPPGNGVPPAAAPAAPAAPAPAAAEAPRALPAEAVTLAQQIESSAANMIQNTGLSGAQMVQALVEEFRIPPNAAQAMLDEVRKVYQRPGTIPGQGPPLSSAPQRGATAAQLGARAEALGRGTAAPIRVYHGTNSTTYVPAREIAGSSSAQAELQALASKHGIKDWLDVPTVLERWASEGRIAQTEAQHARALREASKSKVEAPASTALAFDEFKMPGADSNELGVHFGTEQQAKMFGDVFPFDISIERPLRLPDLGVWSPDRVVDAARKAGVKISGAEAALIKRSPDPQAATRALLRKKGYDGIVYENAAEGAGDSYIILDPKQIKPVKK